MFRSAETKAWKPKLAWPKEAKLQWGKRSDLGGQAEGNDAFVEVFMHGQQYIHADADSFDEAEERIFLKAKRQWFCPHTHWRRDTLHGHQHCVGCGMSNMCASPVYRLGRHLDPLDLSTLSSLFVGSHLKPAEDLFTESLKTAYRNDFLRARLLGLDLPDGEEPHVRGSWGPLRRQSSQVVLDLLEANGGFEALRSPALMWNGRKVADCSTRLYPAQGETIERGYLAWEFAGKPRLAEYAPAEVMAPYLPLA